MYVIYTPLLSLSKEQENKSLYLRELLHSLSKVLIKVLKYPEQNTCSVRISSNFDNGISIALCIITSIAKSY